MAFFPSKSIAVLGGGITGLTAAYRLTELGHRVRLFEQSARVGGAVRTELCNGWLIEGGPTSLQEDTPDVTSLLHELGLVAERIEANPAAKNRYVARRGRPVAVPASAPALVLSPLLSPGAKLRMLTELCSRPRVRSEDVSLEEFVRSHLGSEILNQAVQPLVSGIWAGDPAKLSTRFAFPKFWDIEQRHGSLLRGQIAAANARRAREGEARAKTISFQRGLQTLSWALTSRLLDATIDLNSPVVGLVPGERWRIVSEHSERARQDTFDAVIATLPATALARLQIGPPDERPLAGLAEIEHPPLVSLFLGYRREQVAHPLDGFGLLVPAAEKRSMLGAVFSSSLFPGRAPAGCVAFTVMAGGALQPEMARLPAEEIVARVRADLRDLLGVSGDPVFTRQTSWPRAIPQYNLGHEKHLETIVACERKHPRLYIGGQSRNGISLSQCISAGLALAERASR